MKLEIVELWGTRVLHLRERGTDGRTLCGNAQPAVQASATNGFLCQVCARERVILFARALIETLDPQDH